MKITIHKRHVLIFMLHCCVAIMYTYSTMTGMARPYLYNLQAKNTSTLPGGGTCPAAGKTSHKVITDVDRTSGDVFRLKFLFAAAKVLAHFVSGNSCDVHGSRYILLLSVLGSSLLTAIYPSVLLYLPSWAELLQNVMLGFLSGLIMPVLMNLISNWSPKNRQTAFVGLVYAGAPVSLMLEYGLIEYFIVYAEYWRGYYYLMSLVGILYCLAALGTIFSRPSAHPFISAKELALIEIYNGRRAPKYIPWKSILIDTKIYAILAGKLSHMWIQNIKSQHLPAYYKKVLKVEMDTSGSLGLCFPSIIHFLACIIWALCAQKTINKHRSPLEQLRIFYTMFGALVPAIFLVALSYGECNLIIMQVTSTLMHFGMAPMNLGVKANILDLTKNFAGFCEGFINGIATACGILMPPLLQVLITNDTILEWRRLFWITLAVAMYLTTLHYVFVGATRARWDELPLDYTDLDEHLTTTI